MKGQVSLILALLFAIVIALFAVMNGSNVEFNYLFGTAQWPLVLIILGSALIGGLAAGLFGLVRVIQMRSTISQLRKELNEKNKTIEQLGPVTLKNEELENQKNEQVR
jgi:lipopolysaccharide assembly protein A